MESSIKLKETISKYVYYDNYIREYEKKIDPIKNKRKQLHDEILFTLKTNNIPELNVKLPDGSIGYVEKDTTSPLNISFVTSTITNYFMENIKDPSQIKLAQQKALHLVNYIMDNRQIKTNYSLKRTFDK